MKVHPPYSAIVPAPFGAVGIQTDADASQVVRFAFLPPGSKERLPANALAAEAAQQVRRYLVQPDFRFDLPLADAGTAFQRAVWREIAAVAPGDTTTYGTIAKRLGSGPRAVGQACGANPLPLVTPCHRVVAASGGLGGFASQRDHAHFLLATKSWLLQHEANRR
ncbi:MAG: cysteine methyltransferase [Burkholderiaceae bacterium]|nr:cysteine methyltransferase [Burkholderiaceae bacterium]